MQPGEPNVEALNQLMAMLAVVGVVGAVVGLLVIVCLWKIYAKAGQPGWSSIVPFYNMYVQLQIVGRPEWWLVLMFVPLVNMVVGIIVLIDLAKSFGKSAAFGVVGLVLFSVVGLPMLAFGSARYVGPAAAPQQF